MPINTDRSSDERDNECNTTRTYVFPSNEVMPFLANEARSKIWQIVPSMCGCLVCLIFGITLGWPSPIYPKLLPETSLLPITYDQSALIAGFLMIGNIFATPISNFSPFGSKYGILIALIFMLTGWLVIWQTGNIYGVMASRFMVGFGNGYGMVQAKNYIKDLCEEQLGNTLLKLTNLYMILGVIVAFSFGPFVDFRMFSIISLTIVAAVILVCMFLPHTPVELIRFGKLKEADILVHYLKPNLNPHVTVQTISSVDKLDDMNILEIVRNKTLRYNLILLICITFFQQFSGPPATIVYCQIMLTKFGCPHPEMFAIVYAILFFTSNAFGYFYVSKYNTKYCLLFSSIATSVLLILNIFIMYFNLNDCWYYSSFVVMCCFICLHSIGLGCLPFSLTGKLFPKEALKIATQFQIIAYSACAIIVTKLFQLLFTHCEFYVPFVMFGTVAVLSIACIVLFIPHTFPVLTESSKIIQ